MKIGVFDVRGGKETKLGEMVPAQEPVCAVCLGPYHYNDPNICINNLQKRVVELEEALKNAVPPQG